MDIATSTRIAVSLRALEGEESPLARFSAPSPVAWVSTERVADGGPRRHALEGAGGELR